MNPLLTNLKIPGETFQLPSLGLLYTDELSSDVEDAHIHVYPMRTIDEIVMRSADALFTGDALVQTLAHCAPQIVNPRNLFVKDIQFILGCIRVVTYGPEMTISAKGNCEDADYADYVINVRDVLRKSIKLDPTELKTKFELKLGEQLVKFRPITFGSSLELDKQLFQMGQDPDEMITPEYVEHEITVGLARSIVSVDDITDRELIAEWLKALPANWKDQIVAKIADLSNFGINSQVEVFDEKCQVPMLIDFETSPIGFFQ